MDEKKKIIMGPRTSVTATRDVPSNNISAPSAASGDKLHVFYIMAWEYFYSELQEFTHVSSM